MDNMNIDDSLEAVAIIGMACRFPGAKNIDEFWQNLSGGVESISFFSDEELAASGVDSDLLNDSNYVKAGGFLEDIDKFDASFFGMTPREAEIIDPQHRMFLECAWEALEDAGYNSQTEDNRIGVYAGAGLNSYWLKNLISNRNKISYVSDYQISIGNDKDFVPTRISYKLNLKGPSICINTACSTSLVAIQMAYQSLLSYQCDTALAGAVSIRTLTKEGYLYQEGMILSPDGHCRAFDTQAQGTVGGNGAGIVVLKRLEEAILDGDHVYAVIKGAAINNDGSQKIGYTAPSVKGQASVISEALAIAEVEPETITYVEAHGTGTVLGDPIEIEALKQAFQAHNQSKNFCALGSVKTNFGHLDAAAGMAGLIKTVLALKHKMLVPHLHYTQPNPKIDFENSPFYVNTALSKWETKGIPRRAGVSAFGIGGTNAHIVLEEAPEIKPSEKSRPWHLLTISAKTNTALDAATANLAQHLKQNSELNLADVAYTLQMGRRAFSHRRILLCQEVEDAIKSLTTFDPKRVFDSVQEPSDRPIAFMFSGQGSQYVNMAQELYQLEPIFRNQIDLCAELLLSHLKLDLRQVIYPSADSGNEMAQQLKQTAITQPALFSIEYALAKLWMSWGVKPQSMIGHSIGEYVAATLAGVFSLEDALALVAARGQMMQQLPGGAMVAVALPEAEILPRLDDRLSLATINGASRCVVSGSTEAVDMLQQQLANEGIDCRPLRTSHAFHSSMMEPILEPFKERVKAANLKAPQLPFISNVTGNWITDEEATDPEYWVKHLRQTVRFADGLKQVLVEPEQILLEVGPGKTLSTFAIQHPDKSAEQVVLSSLRHPKDPQADLVFLLTTLSKLWLSGVRVDWSEFYANQKRHRLPLPTYPFERQRYWIEALKPLETPSISQVPLGKKPDISDWFYVPAWKSSDIPNPNSGHQTTSSCILVFTDECGLGSQLVKQLQLQGEEVITLKTGSEFAQLSDDVYTLNPGNSNDYSALINEIYAQGKKPQTILHLWNVDKQVNAESNLETVEKSKNLGFYSLIFLVQALAEQQVVDRLQIATISNSTQKVTGEEVLCPEKALVLGACKVIPQEYPDISCSSIDIIWSNSGVSLEKQLVNQLLNDLKANFPDPVVAYRGEHRWVQNFEPIKLPHSDEIPFRLKEKGVYLITGGLGNIGLVFAEHLAKSVQAKIILTSRSSFPVREEWQQWLSSHDEDDRTLRKIVAIKKLEEMGAQVWIANADVSNLQQMQEAIAQAEQRFGSLNGVIHSAGILEKSYIQTASKTEYDQQLESKVYGLLVLQQVLQEHKLDFCLLMSSLSSVLGGLGFAAYSAANIFMDTFAHQQNESSSFPWISVNWDGWQFGEDKQQTSIGRNIAELGMAPQEGAIAFKRILSQRQLNRVIVSTGNLHSRFDKWINLKSLRQPVNREPEELSSYSRPSLPNSYILPEDETEQMLASIWQKLLGIDRVGSQDNFFELGGDSLQAVTLFAQIEKQFGKKLPVATLFQSSTVAEIAQIIRQKTSLSPWKSLVPIKPNGSKPPLFYIHAGGGNLLVYRDLAFALDEDRPVYGLQPRGLDGKYVPFQKIEDMAAHYLTQIRKIQPNGPYFLAGLSSGGTTAWEIAQLLQAQGQEVALLALFDTSGPDYYKLLPPIPRLLSVFRCVIFDSLRKLSLVPQQLMSNFRQLGTKKISISILEKLGIVEKVLNEDQKINQQKMQRILQVRLAQYKSVSNNLSSLEKWINSLAIFLLKRFTRGFYTNVFVGSLSRDDLNTINTDNDIGELPEELQQIQQANVKATQTYVPSVYSGRVILFRASDRPPGLYDDPKLGWGDLAVEGMEIYEIPGNHTSIMKSPILAEKLRICLDSDLAPKKVDRRMDS